MLQFVKTFVLAVSFRDHDGSLCFAYTEQIRLLDPLISEAMAAAKAMDIALQQGCLGRILHLDPLIGEAMVAVKAMDIAL